MHHIHMYKSLLCLRVKKSKKHEIKFKKKKKWWDKTAQLQVTVTTARYKVAIVRDKVTAAIYEVTLQVIKFNYKKIQINKYLHVLK